MKHVINYNEYKVADGEARVVDYHGIQSPDKQAIEEAFGRYEKSELQLSKSVIPRKRSCRSVLRRNDLC